MTAPRISAWVDSVSLPCRVRSTTTTSRPARANNIAVAAPSAGADDDDVGVVGVHH